MMKSKEELLRPPTETEVARALAHFAADVRRHYGDRLRGLYLFGSRARGDHHPHSDVDVAVILTDSGWRYWSEKHALSDLSYDRLVDDGVDIQGWPVPHSAWEDPDQHTNPPLIRAMRRDARPLEADA